MRELINIYCDESFHLENDGESVKAKLKVMIKFALRKFGYPPDQTKINRGNLAAAGRNAG